MMLIIPIHPVDGDVDGNEAGPITRFWSKWSICQHAYVHIKIWPAAVKRSYDVRVIVGTISRLLKPPQMSSPPRNYLRMLSTATKIHCSRLIGRRGIDIVLACVQ